MRAWMAGLVLLVGVGACKDRDRDAADTGTRSAADTIVTEREVQDTTIIRHDTTVTTDTVRKAGGTVGDVDTVRTD